LTRAGGSQADLAISLPRVGIAELTLLIDGGDEAPLLSAAHACTAVA